MNAIEEKTFNPAEHLMNVGTANKPRMYLEVKYRLVWLREQCPDAEISTEILHLDLDKEVSAEVYEWDEVQRKNVKVTKHARGLVIFKATVKTPSGAIATGTKMENAAAFGDFLEKAESGAVGRALAGLGYGTQFTGAELDEGDRLADAPVQRSAPQQERKPSYDPEAPATAQQLQTIQKLQKQLGMSEIASIDGLSFGDCAQLLREYNQQLQAKRQAS